MEGGHGEGHRGVIEGVMDEDMDGDMKGDIEGDMVNYPMFFLLQSTWFYSLDFLLEASFMLKSYGCGGWLVAHKILETPQVLGPFLGLGLWT